jgi:hypothetical protein
MIIEDGIKAQGVSLDNGINFYFLFLDLTIALSKKHRCFEPPKGFRIAVMHLHRPCFESALSRRMNERLACEDACFSLRRKDIFVYLNLVVLKTFTDSAILHSKLVLCR